MGLIKESQDYQRRGTQKDEYSGDEVVVVSCPLCGRFEVLQITIGKPVQLPVWHQYVGRYYLYPSPWMIDWKRHVGRAAFCWLSWFERACRIGSIEWFAPNVVAIAGRQR